MLPCCSFVCPLMCLAIFKVSLCCVEICTSRPICIRVNCFVPCLILSHHFLFLHDMLRFAVLFGLQLLSHSLHYIMRGDGICGGQMEVKSVFGTHMHDWSVNHGGLCRLKIQQNNCHMCFGADHS